MNRRRFVKTGLIFVPTIFACSQGIARLGNLEPEAAAWMRRNKDASGNYTSKSVVCNDWMVKAFKSNGLRSLVVRMNTYTGIGINAVKACLIVDDHPNTSDDISPYGTSLVDGDFAEGSGLTGNGTTKMLLSATHVTDLYGTDNSFSYAVYVCSSNNQSGFSMGMFDGSDFSYLYVSNGSGSSFFSAGATANQISVADSAGSGFYCGTRNSSTSMKLYKRGVEIATTGSPGGVASLNYNVGVLGVNNQNTNPSAPSTKTFGGYQLTKGGVTAPQQVAFDYIWQRGMTILGRAAA